MSDRHRPWAWRLAIVGVLLVGLWLRLYGVSYGLPAVYNQDEQAIMNRTLALAQNHFNPKNFLYPSFYFYALFVWEGAFFVLGRMTGIYRGLAGFQREFFVDPSRIFIAGRVLSALCGTATILATYRLGAKLFDRAAGLGAAALLAVAPFAVRDAHYVKHDVPATLLIVLTLLAAARLMAPRARGSRREWIVAGALAGLAMSTHYYAIFVTLPIAAVTVMGRGDAEAWRSRVRLLAFAAAAAVVVFFAASPFLLAEPGTFLRDAAANRGIVMDRAVAQTGLFASLPRYFSMLWWDAAGWPTALAAALGVVAVLAIYRRRALFLLSFAVPFLLFISNTAPATRYLNPILPVIALFAGWLLTSPARLSTRSRFGGFTSAMWVLLACLAGGLTLSVNGDLFLIQTDTRTLALRTIARQIPAGASVLLQPYSVPLRQSRDGLVESLREHLGSEAKASIKYQQLLNLSPYPAPAYRTFYLGEFSGESRAAGNDPDKIYISPLEITEATDLGPLRARGIEYVVLKYNDREPSLRPLLAALARNATLLADISPYRIGTTAAVRDRVEPFVHNADVRIDDALDRPGPAIRIWRINP